MKTTNDILSDVFSIVKVTDINNLNGGIYKGTRLTDSALNDCVINLITGSTAKFLQNGAVYVKIFFNDLFFNNTYSQDYVTGSEMETLLFDLSEILLKTNGYSFDITSREIYTEQVQETNEHYSILKLNFQL